MNIDAEQLIDDFLKVAALSHMVVSRQDIRLEELPAPHTRPKRLPAKSLAVYVFCYSTRCLKVGKVKSSNQARFTMQHYIHDSCKFNLAKSLLNLKTHGSCWFLSSISEDFDESCIGKWIENHTQRYHFFLSNHQPDALLNLLEVFVQCRLKPLFEGKQLSSARAKSVSPSNETVEYKG